MGSLNLERLLFDATDPTAGPLVGSYLLGAGGTVLTSTTVASDEGLDVNIINASVTVSATDLDIRNLSHTTDSVSIGDGTDTLAIAADGSIAVTDNGSTLSVDDGGGSLTVDGAVTVSATQLDIDDLSAASDNVAISDGTDTLAINADGSINATINNAGDIEVAVNSEYAEDSASADAQILNGVGAVRQDTLASNTSADGDWTWLKTTQEGRLYVDADVSSFSGTLSVQGTVADDAADSGNPVLMGAHAFDQSSALTALSAAGDRGYLASDLYRRVFINDAPSIGLNSQAVSVGDTETALPTTPLVGRTRMFIQNNGSDPLYVGKTGLTTATGMEVSKGGTLSLEIGESIALKGIAPATKTIDVRVLEFA